MREEEDDFTVERRRAVMNCSLQLAVVTWGLAWLAIYNKDKLAVILPSETWGGSTPFWLVLLTVIWVVVSRVVPRTVREIVMVFWFVTLVFSLLWMASADKLGDAVEYGLLALTLIFFTLLLFSRFLRMKGVFRTGLFYTAIAALVAFGSLLFRGGLHEDKFIYVATAVWVFAIFQIWSMYDFARFSREALSGDTVCMYAMMSPWTNTVDSFEAIHNIFPADEDDHHHPRPK